MQAKASFCGGMRFVGKADSGHAVVMDAGAAVGGEDSGPRPSELLLMGLAGCTGMDVISILRKKRQPVTGLEVIVHATQAPDHPKRFTAMTVEYRVSGTGVDPAAVRRAVELSETTYCSVGLTLRDPVTITSTVTMVDGDNAE